MTRYLIKGTYTTGNHTGESYLLRKGGFYTDSNAQQREDTTYSTKSAALRACKILANTNNLNYTVERRENDKRIAAGERGVRLFIYEREEYEPYGVEC